MWATVSDAVDDLWHSTIFWIAIGLAFAAVEIGIVLILVRLSVTSACERQPPRSTND